MEDKCMAFTVEQGQVEVGRILREVATERNVEIEKPIWFDDGTSENPATQYTLQVSGRSGSKIPAAKEFSPRNLTEYDSNEMKVQVRMKIESIIITLKKYE